MPISLTHTLGRYLHTHHMLCFPTAFIHYWVPNRPRQSFPPFPTPSGPHQSTNHYILFFGRIPAPTADRALSSSSCPVLAQAVDRQTKTKTLLPLVFPFRCGCCHCMSITFRHLVGERGRGRGKRVSDPEPGVGQISDPEGVPFVTTD